MAKSSCQGGQLERTIQRAPCLVLPAQPSVAQATQELDFDQLAHIVRGPAHTQQLLQLRYASAYVGRIRLADQHTTVGQPGDFAE